MKKCNVIVITIYSLSAILHSVLFSIILTEKKFFFHSVLILSPFLIAVGMQSYYVIICISIRNNVNGTMIHPKYSNSFLFICFHHFRFHLNFTLIQHYLLLFCSLRLYILKRFSNNVTRHLPCWCEKCISQKLYLVL